MINLKNMNDKNEGYIDELIKGSLVEKIKFSLNLLGRSSIKQVTNSMNTFFDCIYQSWKTIRLSKGFEASYKLSLFIWETIWKTKFDSILKELGIKEVKDIQTLGIIRQKIAEGYPLPYKIIENTSERHIGHTLWCPNPICSPPDKSIYKVEYYKCEAALTDVLYKDLVKWAGMTDYAEARLGRAMCRGDEVCECIIERKRRNSNNNNKEVEAAASKKNKAIIANQEKIMSDITKFMDFSEIINKISNRPIIEITKDAIVRLIYFDYTVWKEIYEPFGFNEGKRLHAQTYLFNTEAWLLRAKQSLGIPEIRNISDVSKIIKFIYNYDLRLFEIVKEDREKIEANVVACPWAYVVKTLFNEKINSAYFNSLSLLCGECLQKYLKIAGVDKVIEIRQDKSICSGDDVCKIIIQNK